MHASTGICRCMDAVIHSHWFTNVTPLLLMLITLWLACNRLTGLVWDPKRILHGFTRILFGRGRQELGTPVSLYFGCLGLRYLFIDQPTRLGKKWLHVWNRWHVDCWDWVLFGIPHSGCTSGSRERERERERDERERERRERERERERD